MTRESKKRGKKVKQRVRKYREALKSNLERYEEAKRLERDRYQRRKEQGKIKSINDLTPRQQRKLRKGSRARSKKSYDKKRKVQEPVQGTMRPHSMRENSMQTPTHQNISETPTSAILTSGKRRSRRNRRKMRLEIQKLKKELTTEKSKKEK
ncbi:unnamed protein product [Acanthoscelides obtectus]|uniref:Uncharacterized protein n=1 Tax=Acanthoscelides obtectus TaxID=200917 RepID=A0A9P0PD72_ACAOB|nr:unnamed protein product [Acanthoscelides obtectus]CAK1641705.1 hypothetical protein AOBTE_LOCUS12568 [Acanthoscelides obtectus]